MAAVQDAAILNDKSRLFFVAGRADSYVTIAAQGHGWSAEIWLDQGNYIKNLHKI
jgi:hypothetical protein